MIRAFTDSVRLQHFAKENNLTAPDGSAQMLEIPVKGAVEYLEQFIKYGVHGVWFNSDTVSDGYFIPLAQLRPIKEHLAKINWHSVTNRMLPLRRIIPVLCRRLILQNLPNNKARKLKRHS